MLLKQTPEDFVVEEIPLSFSKHGDYVILLLEKRQLNTEDALQIAAKKLGILRKNIGFAGAKDKQAITKQYISIKKFSDLHEKILSFSHEQIKLSIYSEHTKPLSLGDLLGNKFIITIRELEKPLTKKTSFLNYFGEQRFGIDKSNIDIGRFLVKKQFKQAAALLSLPETEPISHILKIPRHTLMMYIHAYQSWMWNTVLEKLEHPSELLPIIGFGSDLSSCSKDVKEQYEELLHKEAITPRDFIIRQLQGMSSEGDMRKTIIEVSDLTLGAFQKDTHGGYQIATFTLPKGSYATVFVEELVK